MSKLRIGLGETVITPDEAVRMHGFARSQVSTGTHDELHARSLLVEDAEGSAAVLMAVSLCTMSGDYGAAIRAGITQATGISGERIVVACTHTHSGPTVGSSPDTCSEEEVAESAASPRYRQFLVERCVASAVEAWQGRAPGRIGIASTHVLELGRHRRTLQYGGLHPDPEVAVIRIEDAGGGLRGVAFNYGCHPSALDWQNTLFSEDWPYYAIRGVKEQVGDDVWAAYFQAAQGDINVGYQAELSAVGVDMPVRSYDYIQIKGAQMADAVLAALPDIETASDVAVATAIDCFDYPLRQSYPVSLEQAQAEADAARAQLAVAEADPELRGTRRGDEARRRDFQADQRLQAARQFYEAEERPATRSLQQQAVRIGDAAFVSFPGEMFSDIGLAIKGRSPLDKTYVLGVACGPGGYLPSAKEFAEGDYEVDGSAYSPETEAVCIESSVELLRRVAG